MIIVKLKQQLEKNNMTQAELANITKIRPNTISAYYHGTMQRIDVDHIDILCKTFNLKDIRGLIDYETDEPELIFGLTPLIALEATINKVIYQYKSGITREQLSSHESFLHSMFLDIFKYLYTLSNDEKYKPHKELCEEKLAILFFTCIKYGFITSDKIITDMLLKIQALNN